MIEPEILSMIKERTIFLITTHKGLKHLELMNKIVTDYMNLSDADAVRIIHELVQEGKLKRIEYIIDDYPASIFTFYLPGSSRIL